MIRCGGPRIRAVRPIDDAPDNRPHNRNAVGEAWVNLHDQIIQLVSGSLSETEQGVVATHAITSLLNNTALIRFLLFRFGFGFLSFRSRPRSHNKRVDVRLLPGFIAALGL